MSLFPGARERAWKVVVVKVAVSAVNMVFLIEVELNKTIILKNTNLS
jgi:hypothetical protein